MAAGPLLSALLATSLSAQAIVNTVVHQGTFAGGVAYDPVDDALIVVDEGGLAKITWYSRTSGSLLRQINAPQPPGAYTPAPIGGFVDSVSGNLWIVDEAELVYEMDRWGSVLRYWSTRPSVTDVSAMTWDPCSDTVFVANDSGSFVQEFDKNGTPLSTITLGPYGSVDADGCTYDPVGRVFLIGDDTADSILVVDRAGVLLASYSTAVLGISPEGLDVDTRTGSVFVADTLGTQAVHELSGILSPPAPGAVVLFGSACANVPLRAPARLRCSGVARVGSGIGIAAQFDLAPGALAVLNGSLTQAALPLAFLGGPGCTLHALPDILSLVEAPNVNGRIGLDLCLPNAPALAGATVYFSAVAIDVSIPRVSYASEGLGITIQP
ncbi:MAG: hypothetical protein IPM29_04845 [Planctomycetes bacterium]|nr:hypothetical protein [Planctomycetota bacterium]